MILFIEHVWYHSLASINELLQFLQRKLDTGFKAPFQRLESMTSQRIEAYNSYIEILKNSSFKYNLDGLYNLCTQNLKKQIGLYVPYVERLGHPVSKLSKLLLCPEHKRNSNSKWNTPLQIISVSSKICVRASLLG